MISESLRLLSLESTAYSHQVVQLKEVGASLPLSSILPISFPKALLPVSGCSSTLPGCAPKDGRGSLVIDLSECSSTLTALIMTYKAPHKFNFFCPLPMHDARMKSFRGCADQLLNLSEASNPQRLAQIWHIMFFCLIRHAILEGVLIHGVLKQITETGCWRTRTCLCFVLLQYSIK